MGGGGVHRHVFIGGYFLFELKCVALLSPDYAEHRAPPARKYVNLMSAFG